MRSLSPEEAELWAQVTRTICPLSREPLKPKAAETEKHSAPERGGEPAAKQTVEGAGRPARPPLHHAPHGKLHRSATLDGSWDKRLRGGAVEPDRVLDLHGMSLETAWQAIDTALERAVAAGERVLLLITGHHRPGGPPVERGRIRAAVHDWLAASRHASRIAAVRGAHRRHGGGGSLYIVLRRHPRR